MAFNIHHILAIALLCIGFALFNERVLHGGFAGFVIAGFVIGVLVHRVWEWAGREKGKR